MVGCEALQRVMHLRENIRDFSVISHVSHGKSTLIDSLVAAAAGDVRMTDSRADEAQRGFTIKSNGVALYHECSGNEYLINVFDTPGHVDFSHEVSVALRMTDGALLVVDSVEGVRVQTETVIRQALRERVQPVLTINKIDRYFIDDQYDGEDAYKSFKSVTENVNTILESHKDPVLGDVRVYPEKGNVAFSAGLYGWAFTLKYFGKMYASKFRVDETKMTERLWGENFFDPQTQRWTSKNTGSSTCKRGFVFFCYEPIKEIIRNCLNDDKDQLWLKLESLGVTMRSEDKDLIGKALMKRVMQSWLPASTALLEMVISHLPSPVIAQKYRVQNLYAGPLDDPYAHAIANCNTDGPLMLFISKMIPAADKGRFLAVGRVFSGHVSKGMKVRIMGPEYVHGEQRDLCLKRIQRTVICMGKKTKNVDDVPCGNIIALVGVDDVIKKTATLTNEKEVYAHPICALQFSVSPMARIAVCCQDPTHNTKLVDGLKRLAQSDPLVECVVEESGEHVIACAGELHLEICLKDLEDFVDGVLLKFSDPVVSFRETVLHKSSTSVVCKCQNKHLYIRASPIGDDLAKAIDEGRISRMVNPRDRARILIEEFGWDEDVAMRIWGFGPDTTGPNMVVDMSKGVQYLNEIKDSLVSAFQSASAAGALAGERMRGICFEVSNTSFHGDPSSMGSTQVLPTVESALFAAQLTAKPRLLEPIYLVKIEAPKSAVYKIEALLSQKRGRLVDLTRSASSVQKIEVHLPLMESIGFTTALATATSGEALAKWNFEHWSIIESDPLEAGSEANLLLSICKKKGRCLSSRPLK